MTGSSQLFGWTEMVSPPVGEYVRFVSVTETEHEKMRFVIRDKDATWHQLDLPENEALMMAFSIILNLRNKDRALSKLPPLTLKDLMQ